MPHTPVSCLGLSSLDYFSISAWPGRGLSGHLPPDSCNLSCQAEALPFSLTLENGRKTEIWFLLLWDTQFPDEQTA